MVFTSRDSVRQQRLVRIDCAAAKIIDGVLAKITDSVLAKITDGVLAKILTS